MDLQATKCVMIIDDSLPLGVIANIAAIMGISLGKKAPEIVGIDAHDADGNPHLGLIQFPVSVLKASTEKINQLRSMLYTEDYADVSVIDFSNVAQETYTYEDFLSRMQESSANELIYYGLTLEGPKKKINKLTGSLPLLR
ncbi:MAG: DUF2000 domain-containing protein [Oscillospiraceae bacterium]|nr:DUF2000 domain-containing protein [Oscillospiraceae bacterium]